MDYASTTTGGIAATERAKQSGFLSYVNDCSMSARRRLEDLAERLSAAGFYGPPENAKADTQPSEDNVRGNVVEELRRIERLLAVLDHQIGQAL